MFSAPRSGDVKVWYKIPQKDYWPNVQCPIAEIRIIPVLMTHGFLCESNKLFLGNTYNFR
jgi:hypothetical protein